MYIWVYVNQCVRGFCKAHNYIYIYMCVCVCVWHNMVMPPPPLPQNMGVQGGSTYPAPWSEVEGRKKKGFGSI